MIAKLFNIRGLAVAFAIGMAGGGYIVHKFFQAEKVSQLERENKELRASYERLAVIEQKYLKQSEEIEDLRRSDASVDSYLSTVIPASLQRLLNRPD